jgi:membrane-associated phospholipid phosphatase
MPRAALKMTGLLCLVAFAVLSLVVAHCRGPYGFEAPVIRWLVRPDESRVWSDVSHVLAAPAIGAALVVSLAFGVGRRAALRVAAYAALGAAAFLLGEQVVEPLVRAGRATVFSFPSGHVTAVSATALAMWLALHPLLGARARTYALALGIAWTLLMSLAVVAVHWHTPVDAAGGILLSVGVVAGGASVLEPALSRSPFMGAVHAR